MGTSFGWGRVLKKSLRLQRVLDLSEGMVTPLSDTNPQLRVAWGFAIA